MELMSCRVIGFALNGVTYRLLVGRTMQLEARRGYLYLWDHVADHELPRLLRHLLLKQGLQETLGLVDHEGHGMRLVIHHAGWLRRTLGLGPSYHLDQFRAGWCPVRNKELVCKAPLSRDDTLDAAIPAALWGIYAVLTREEWTRMGLRLIHGGRV